MSQPGQTAMQNHQNLCDYCHTKPKFGQYNYCSKTCAASRPVASVPNIKPTPTVKPRAPSATANNLCDFCKKTPKHPGYDFCGKSCAQSAKAGSSAQQTFKPTQVSSAPKSNNAGKASVNAIAQAAAALAGNSPAAIDPTQIANLVVQQLQTLLPNTTQTTSKTGGAALSTLKQALQHTSNAQPPLRVQTQQPDPEEPGECLIPGCGQPAYVDAKGVKASAYCSMRHRQEAVDSGLASPCIFCLQLPQSETDYFCSKECREESLNKDRYEIVDE
ncbi:hypothetical protein J3R30DRAFT_3703935 [Lentinula aciculospora]|uniref:Uncharacterized protein n=1 Tax=Lentinula aciculospora TaxID=153920 RepID=A0A9W9A9D7_9AGAR|nr:hypothetical protein J3R30DRAFT_3703935 [Lentinula aciculospora]